MTKCDFCEMFTPDGKCHEDDIWREFSCEKAIKRMMKALKKKKK